MKTVHCDEYTGPRWVYRSPHRPVPLYMLPNDAVPVITPSGDSRVVTVTRPLAESFVSQWDLELVAAPEPAEEVEVKVFLKGRPGGLRANWRWELWKRGHSVYSAGGNAYTMEGAYEQARRGTVGHRG